MQFLAKAAVAIAMGTTLVAAPVAAETPRVGYETVEGVSIFFREAGDPANPAIVLLHGFPSSSH